MIEETTTTYELSMTKDYVKSWGMLEGIRELLQNAIDSDSPFEWEFIDGVLLIHSKNAELKAKTLLLGQSSKASDDNKIGNFGDGYKVAMVALLRAGYRVMIYNGSVEWDPKFLYSIKYDEDQLCIVSSKAEKPNEGVTFEVKGLSEDDMAAIQASCLHMQDDDEIGGKIKTRFGDILLEKPGDLYVGGLYICHTDLQHGYDVNPSNIKLERDRKTVDGWDLKLLTKDMWIDGGDMKAVAQMISDGVPDLYHADIGTEEIVKQACYDLFCEKYPGAIIAKDQDELDAMVRDGMDRVVVVDRTFDAIVSGHPDYITSAANMEATKSPTEELEDWFNASSRNMHKRVKDSFRIILEKSVNWHR